MGEDECTERFAARFADAGRLRSKIPSIVLMSFCSSMTLS